MTTPDQQPPFLPPSETGFSYSEQPAQTAGLSAFDQVVDDRLRTADDEERLRKERNRLIVEQESADRRQRSEQQKEEDARVARIRSVLAERSAQDARGEGTDPNMLEMWGPEEVQLCADFVRRMQGKFETHGTRLPKARWSSSWMKRIVQPPEFTHGFSIGWIGGTIHAAEKADAEIFLCEDGTLRALHGDSKYGHIVTGIPLVRRNGAVMPFDVGSYSDRTVTKTRMVQSPYRCHTPWGECDTCQSGGHKIPEEYQVHEFEPASLLDKLSTIAFNVERNNRKPAAYSRWSRALR